METEMEIEMKKIVLVVLLALGILVAFVTPVFANPQEIVIAIKEPIHCMTGEQDECVGGYLYHVIVQYIDADMVMVEMSQDEGATYEVIETQEWGTSGLVSYTVDMASTAGDCEFRVTAFNLDRSVRLIPIIEQDRTGVSFLPIVAK